MTAHPQEIWHRREDEGAKPYRGLTLYLAQGADRSTAKVARKLGISKTIVQRWSAQFDWVERTKDYDQHVTEARLARLASARENLVDQQVTIAAQMFTLVKSKMRALRGNKLEAQGVARLFYVASQAIQRAFGDEPLANAPPKIVFLRVQRNIERNFKKESEGDLSGNLGTQNVQ